MSHKPKHRAVVKSAFWAVLVGKLAENAPEWWARFVAELIRRMNE
ncbi:hypothetical protein [Arthrobacter sp. 31Y]|nr:hypothetical protein [Arthrobacter sp. 31Y]